MDAVALLLEDSVEADVSRAFAWKFRTNVATWNDPPATFVLDGAFTDGSQGSTVLPGQTPLTWWIRDVHEERSFAIEMLLDRATLIRMVFRCRRRRWHEVDPAYRALGHQRASLS